MNEPTPELQVVVSEPALAGLLSGGVQTEPFVLYQIGIRCGAPVLALARQSETVGLKPIKVGALTLWVDPGLARKLSLLGSVYISAEVPSYGPLRYTIDIRPTGDSSEALSCDS